MREQCFRCRTALASGSAAAWVPLAIALGVAGCATDQQRTRAEGAGIGAVVGAVVGHAVGGKEGAAAGALIGGAAGAAYGNEVAKKKAAYAAREDALKASAAQAQAVAQAAQQANDAAVRDIATLQAAAEQLRRRTLNAEQRRRLVMTSRQNMEAVNSRLTSQIGLVRDELTRQQGVLAREEQLAQQTKEASPPSALRLVTVSMQELQGKERALELARAQLAQLDSRRAF